MAFSDILTQPHHSAGSSMDHPALTQPRSEIIQKVEGRIRLIEKIQGRHLESEKDYETYRSDVMKWWSYNQAMLRRMFTDHSISEEYSIAIPQEIERDWQHCSFIGLQDSVAHQVVKLRSMLEQLEFYPERSADASTIGQRSATRDDLIKIFVVHGHDEGALQAVARFLDTIGLKAIVLREQPDQGRTIIEKFDACAREVGFAVVLLTPDDLGGPAYAPDQAARARQNVIFELGYFVGSLGRGRVCLLRKGDVEIPSDLFGVIYSDFDHPAESWKVKLARELKAAEFEFDSAKVLS
jgi:predicted nucleotide-binding protein